MSRFGEGRPTDGNQIIGAHSDLVLTVRCCSRICELYLQFAVGFSSFLLVRAAVNDSVVSFQVKLDVTHQIITSNMQRHILRVTVKEKSNWTLFLNVSHDYDT